MRTRWIGPVLLLASMLVTAGLPQDRAHARTRAGADVRIGQHEDFRRLVIEWDHPVQIGRAHV